MLRRSLIGLSVLVLAIAIVLIAVVHAAFGPMLGLYLLVQGGILLGAIVLERSHYRPRIDRTHGAWQITGERFVDPVSKRLMEVRYNPETGERDYVEVKNSSQR